MDRKSFLVLFISMLLIMSWYRLVQHWYPQPVRSAGGTNTVVTNIVSTNAAGIVTTNTVTNFVAMATGTNDIAKAFGTIATNAPLAATNETVMAAITPLVVKAPPV